MVICYVTMQNPILTRQRYLEHIITVFQRMTIYLRRSKEIRRTSLQYILLIYTHIGLYL